MTTEAKPLRNRKGKQVYAALAALTLGFGFACYVGAEGALYVTFATAVCAVSGVGIWGNVGEHKAESATKSAGG